MRIKLADFIPNDSLKVFRNLLKIHNDERSFERDISETLGFGDADDLSADVKEAGMLGAITCLRLFEKISFIYE